MIIVLMGVTGSGKTAVGQNLAASLGWQYFDADEFHSAANIEKMKSGVPLNDAEDSQPRPRALNRMCRHFLDSDMNAIAKPANFTRQSRSFVAKFLREGRVHFIPLYYVLRMSDFARAAINT